MPGATPPRTGDRPRWSAPGSPPARRPPAWTILARRTWWGRRWVPGPRAWTGKLRTTSAGRWPGELIEETGGRQPAQPQLPQGARLHRRGVALPARVVPGHKGREVRRYRAAPAARQEHCADL